MKFLSPHCEAGRSPDWSPDPFFPPFYILFAPYVPLLHFFWAHVASIFPLCKPYLHLFAQCMLYWRPFCGLFLPPLCSLCLLLNISWGGVSCRPMFRTKYLNYCCSNWKTRNLAQEQELNPRPPDKYYVALPLSYPGHRYLEIPLAIIHIIIMRYLHYINPAPVPGSYFPIATRLIRICCSEH